MTAFAFKVKDTYKLNIFAIADVMEDKKGINYHIMYYYDHFLVWTGWKVERGASCIHCTILPSHTQTVADQFINDLREAVTTVKVSLTYVTYIYMCGVSLKPLRLL